MPRNARRDDQPARPLLGTAGTGAMSDVLVLCYHAVSPTWPAGPSVTPSDFRAQLELLLKLGYQGRTLVDALTTPPAGRTMAVTFDDAHVSVAELARPILDELGIPATVFVPTEYAGTDRLMGWAGYDQWLGTPHESELRCLSWEALNELADSGWEIGSHTVSHPRLTRIDDDQLEHELVGSRRVCEERMGRPCVSIAYPYSDEDDRVVAATRRAGYGLGVTVSSRWAPPFPLRWPRVGAFYGNSAWHLAARAGRARLRAVDSAIDPAMRTVRAAQRALRR
jgi:peptidoglycan/xylan/chitin deacetylase (PgdA/CDA1 family)